MGRRALGECCSAAYFVCSSRWRPCAPSRLWRMDRPCWRRTSPSCRSRMQFKRLAGEGRFLGGCPSSSEDNCGAQSEEDCCGGSFVSPRGGRRASRLEARHVMAQGEMGKRHEEQQLALHALPQAMQDKPLPRMVSQEVLWAPGENRQAAAKIGEPGK